MTPLTEVVSDATLRIDNGILEPLKRDHFGSRDDRKGGLVAKTAGLRFLLRSSISIVILMEVRVPESIVSQQVYSTLAYLLLFAPSVPKEPLHNLPAKCSLTDHTDL